MIIPTKHQNIIYNPMVLGADILFLLRKEQSTVEELYQVLKQSLNLDLDIFYDTLTYLWLIEAIKMNDNEITRNIDVSK